MIFQSFTKYYYTVGAVLFCAVVGAIVLGWSWSPDQFFSAYWFGLMLWIQLSIGCLLLLLIQHLTGGNWGRISTPFLCRATTALFVLAPLCLPVFFALPHIFTWTAIRAGTASPQLVAKHFWLNEPAFILRSLLYLVICLGISALWSTWNRSDWALRQNRLRLHTWSGPALVVLALTVSFSSIDWMMSLEPVFASSIYPFLYFAESMVGATAALAMIGAFLKSTHRWPDKPELLLDLGKILFASLLTWFYLEYSQLIVLWMGDLPNDVVWYLVRLKGGWFYVTLFLVLFQFFIPFLFLLSQKLKRNPTSLFIVAGGVLIAHAVDVFWMMAPGRVDGSTFSLLDIILPALIGACWMWWFLGGWSHDVWLSVQLFPKTNKGES